VAVSVEEIVLLEEPVLQAAAVRVELALTPAVQVYRESVTAVALAIHQLALTAVEAAAVAVA
jgi:hypothetical protein